MYRSTFDDSAGELGALGAYEPSLVNPNFCVRMEVGDVSGDGLPDIVMANDLEVYSWLEHPADPIGGPLDLGGLDRERPSEQTP